MGISTHILNTATGKPAVAVGVSLARAATGRQSWQTLQSALTDEDGRCRSLLPANEPMTPGTYVIRFETAGYHQAQATPGLYPYVEIAFVVEAGEAHYHIPLLLTAHGYTTYRGS